MSMHNAECPLGKNLSGIWTSPVQGENDYIWVTGVSLILLISLPSSPSPSSSSPDPILKRGYSAEHFETRNWMPGFATEWAHVVDPGKDPVFLAEWANHDESLEGLGFHKSRLGITADIAFVFQSPASTLVMLMEWRFDLFNAYFIREQLSLPKAHDLPVISPTSSPFSSFSCFFNSSLPLFPPPLPRLLATQCCSGYDGVSPSHRKHAMDRVSIVANQRTLQARLWLE